MSSFANRGVHFMPAAPQRQVGFTLLELLAVIVIIGIVISFASLSIGQNSSRIAQEEAQRLQALIKLSSDEAVLQGREFSLEFDRQRYRFLELLEGDWLPVKEDPLLRERALPEALEVQLSLEGVDTNFEDKTNLPRIFILSSGEITAFEMRLKTLEGEEYTLQGQMNGKLSLAGKKDDDI
jgi:general secretion pathway protein H